MASTCCWHPGICRFWHTLVGHLGAPGSHRLSSSTSILATSLLRSGLPASKLLASSWPRRGSRSVNNFGISPSLPRTHFKVQSRAVPEALDPEMSPSTSRQVPWRSETWIKTPGRLFGPLGEILKILARHETWNLAF